jgi:hypothetical protein
MGHEKLIHNVVDQIKCLLTEKGVDSHNYKFQKTSTSNIKIIDRETCKSCILYLEEFEKCEIYDKSKLWLKHLDNVVCKVLDKECDNGFCGKKCKRTIKGVIGKFDKCNILQCEIPITIKDKITGESVIIPPHNYVDRLIFKRSDCDGMLTEGTSVHIGLSEIEYPEYCDITDLHDAPGILSDDLNEQNQQWTKVFTEDIISKSTILTPHYLMVRCGLGKEINNGSIDVLIDIVEFH